MKMMIDKIRLNRVIESKGMIKLKRVMKLNRDNEPEKEIELQRVVQRESTSVPNRLPLSLLKPDCCEIDNFFT